MILYGSLILERVTVSLNYRLIAMMIRLIQVKSLLSSDICIFNWIIFIYLCYLIYLSSRNPFLLLNSSINTWIWLIWYKWTHSLAKRTWFHRLRPIGIERPILSEPTISVLTFKSRVVKSLFLEVWTLKLSEHHYIYSVCRHFLALTSDIN